MDQTADTAGIAADAVSVCSLPFAGLWMLVQLPFLIVHFFSRRPPHTSPIDSDDIERRKKVYLSDWTDGFKNMKKVIPAVLFLYFACLSPVISFGTIASQITNDSIGVVEFLLSAGCSGMAYSILCGQPMAFIAPTGLTLAFISGLFRFCTLKGLPFFPVYAWVGLWTSLFFTLSGLGGSSSLIRFCTRFTDEIFNALLSLNFIYEALASIRRSFARADPNNLTTPFVGLAMAMTTFRATLGAASFESSKFLNQRIRRLVKNFGPALIFCTMSAVNTLPGFEKFAIPTLSVPDTFQLAGGRSFVVAINSISNRAKLLCSLPAVLLTALFFMDQNISVRVVNNPDNKLKKGAAYNMDMVALGIITGVLSIFGLPWMCGATVQSMNHVKAMTDSEYNTETDEIEIVDVTETRLTGFVVHALLASSLLLLPALRHIPIPVVSGVFLFLGRKLLSGNSFIQRIRDTFVEEDRLLEDNPIRMLGRKRTAIFTGIQILCLAGLWTFKQNSSTAIFFPSVIGLLMAIRSFVLPKIFDEEELVELGDPTPSKHLDDGII
jgi:HCO3- transporter family